MFLPGGRADGRFPSRHVACLTPAKPHPTAGTVRWRLDCITAKTGRTRRYRPRGIACRPRADTDHSGTGLPAGPLRLLRPCRRDRSECALTTPGSTPLPSRTEPIRAIRARARSARPRHLLVPGGPSAAPAARPGRSSTTAGHRGRRKEQHAEGRRHYKKQKKKSELLYRRDAKTRGGPIRPSRLRVFGLCGNAVTSTVRFTVAGSGRDGCSAMVVPRWSSKDGQGPSRAMDAQRKAVAVSASLCGLFLSCDL
jgi:hypothetical protein